MLSIGDAEFLTPKDVRERYGIPVARVRFLYQNGYLPIVVIGRAIYIDDKDVQTFIKLNRIGANHDY